MPTDINARKVALAEARAEQAYGQALWYAWGRIDSGEFKGQRFANPLDAFHFAERVKVATLAFELQTVHSLDSVQNAWDKYVESNR